MKNLTVRFSLRRVSVGLATLSSFVCWVQAAEPVGANFLTINQSPRYSALGDAGFASVSNASSLYMNPAGMAAAPSSQLYAAHTQLFEDSNLSSFAFNQPFGGKNMGRALGLTATYMTYGEIEGRNEDRTVSSSFKSSDLSVGVGYAQILGRATAGFTVKAIQQRIAGFSATGVALDLGLQMPVPVRGLRVGMGMTNLGSSMKYISEKYELPTTARLGLDYQIKQFNILADVGTPVHGGKSWFSLGTEFTPVSMLSLRAGYLMQGESRISGEADAENELARFAGMSGGIGLKLGRYIFDYAMTPHSSLGNTQKLGFSVNFR